MLSFKRLLYIILIVAILGGVIVIYNIQENRLTSSRFPDHPTLEREFLKSVMVDESENPRVWILGNPEDEQYGDIYKNVRQFCADIHLVAVENECLDVDKIENRDLLVFCDASVSHYAEPAELESFIAGGGRVILAAGLGEEDENVVLWPAFGIRGQSEGEDFHDLTFERPLLPVQPDEVFYEGNSRSDGLDVCADATVYIRDEESDVPILYSYSWKDGSICLINGTFLKDARCMGLLTGAIGAVVPDFIYPVLGIKTVFMDNFPLVTPDGDALCRKIYGYSMEGFIRDVVWPAFQGISLRTDTPYTAAILPTSSDGGFEEADDSLAATIGRFVLQIDGELADAGVQQKEDYALFPATTEGNTMEDGNLFLATSELGAYGLVSHMFDVGGLMVSDDGIAGWDLYKKQIGLFESEVLNPASWLEGRTLTQAEDDISSYRNMDYGWTVNGNCVELYCGGAVKGQAFFYHTDNRIANAEGLTYQDIGNGYYLLRVLENKGIITLEEE